MNVTVEEQQQLFKQVLGNYPTGATVMTVLSEKEKPTGLTVNSFASLSLDPLMIIWSIDHRASSYNDFVEGDKFAVHILAADQANIAKTFASSGADKFSQCQWGKSDFNLPIIEGVFGVLQCKVHKTLEGGDHTIIIGNVIDIDLNDKDPILYHRRKLGAIPTEFYNQ